MYRMKRGISLVLTLALTIGMLLPGTVSVQAASTVQVSVTVTYGQTEARSMLTELNALRTADSWQWSASGEKIAVSGLSALKYDYGIEKIAMQRAVEIARKFSHLRPDGSTYVDAIYTYSYSNLGENIASGHKSAEQVLTSWWEEDEDYAGQEHRRNMQSATFNYIGIGHVIYNGVNYWVQVFSDKATGVKDSGANDSTQTATMTVASSLVKDTDTLVSTDSGSGFWSDVDTSVDGSYEEEDDERPTDAVLKASVKLKKKSGTVKKGKTCFIPFATTLRRDWVKKIVFTPANKKIVTVKNVGVADGKVYGKKVGTTTIKCKVSFYGGGSKTVTYKIKVTKK